MEWGHRVKVASSLTGPPRLWWARPASTSVSVAPAGAVMSPGCLSGHSSRLPGWTLPRSSGHCDLASRSSQDRLSPPSSPWPKRKPHRCDCPRQPGTPGLRAGAVQPVARAGPRAHPVERPLLASLQETPTSTGHCFCCSFLSLPSSSPVKNVS